LTQFSLERLLTPKKILPFYHNRKVADKDDLPPISVELHWTSNCNYDCYHCSYGNRRQSSSYLSKKIIEQLIEDFSEIGVSSVYLSGGGEPTILKGWDDYAKRMIDNGIEVALITNSSAVKEKHLPLIDAMNYVAVSVYSLNQKNYHKITRGKGFESQFLLPSRYSNHSVTIGARCVINEYNYNELFLIYQKAINSGFDYILFIPVVDYEAKGLSLSDKHVEAIKHQIISNNIDSSRTNLLSVLDKKISHYKCVDYLFGNTGQSRVHCDSIYIRSNAFVNYDGGVYLCQPDIGNKKLEVGNLNRSRFREIWNSSRHRDVVSILNDRWSSGECVNCRSIAYNMEITSLLDGVSYDEVLKDCPDDKFI